MHNANKLKPCPFCAEHISASARFCPLCESALTSTPQTPYHEPSAFRIAGNEHVNAGSSPVVVLVLLGVCGMIAACFWNSANKIAPTPSVPLTTTESSSPPATDAQRKKLFLETFDELKRTPSIPIKNSYRIVANEAPELPEDAEFEAQIASQQGSYSTDSSYNSSPQYSSYADQQACQNLVGVHDNLKCGNYAAAAREADSCLRNAQLTGDPEAVRGAQAVRDAVRRTTGY